MDKKKIAMSVVAITLIASAAGYYFFSNQQSQAMAEIKAPVNTIKPAPLFSKQALDGSNVSLASLKGKVVLIDFFATWCPPCEAEIPHFIKLAETYKDKIQIIGISVDDDSTSLQPFIKKHTIQYPIIRSEGELDKLFGGITSIPTTFILDKNLQIVDKVVGYRDISYFENVIKQHL